MSTKKIIKKVVELVWHSEKSRWLNKNLINSRNAAEYEDFNSQSVTHPVPLKHVSNIHQRVEVFHYFAVVKHLHLQLVAQYADTIMNTAGIQGRPKKEAC